MTPTFALRAAPLVALALAGATLAGCKKPEAEQAAAQPLTVSVARIETRTLQAGLSATGLFIPREEAAVAPELSGFRVAQVMVDEGDMVARGQPLARLDDALLQAQIEQARAALAQQQVAAERAAAEAARVQGLDGQGVLSDEAIAQRRLEARAAQAAVEVARAQLRDLETREGRMTIRAPVAGRILERAARPGDTSSPGTNMFRIARDGLIELDAEIPESELHRVRAGDSAQVTLTSGAQVAGKVRLVSPRVDPDTKLGRARVLLPVRPDLRPGGFGRVTFTGAARAVRAAPEAAVRFDADGAYVMVVGDQDRVRRVNVRTGQRAGGWIELLDGPPVSSRVALGGSAFVLEGDQVRPVAANTAPAPAAVRSAAAGSAAR